MDADGIWAALTGERPERPTVQADIDFIYGHVSGGRKVVKNLYVTAGVRRLALKYDIQVESRPNFTNKPGLWDPLIGVGWHYEGKKTELHAVFEGGGFGVGADTDISGGVRFDWKPIPHFGVTLGYAGIHLKLTETVLSNTALTRTFTAEQTLHGPIAGIGFYF